MSLRGRPSSPPLLWCCLRTLRWGRPTGSSSPSPTPPWPGTLSRSAPCSHHPRHHIQHTGCFSLQASCVVRASCASCDQRLGFGATQIVKKLLQHLGWVFHTVQLHGAHQVSCQLKAMAIVGIGVTDSGCCRRQSIQLHKWHQDVV